MDTSDYPGYGRSWPTFPQSYSLLPAPLPQGYGPDIASSRPHSYSQPYNQRPVPSQTIQSSPGKGISADAPAVGSFEPGTPGGESQYHQKPQDQTADGLSSARGLQHFININASRTRLQDGEQELESAFSSSRWFSERRLKKAHRTMTVDKERGRRTPHMQILQTRLISTLEEDGHEAVTLTINDEPMEKGQTMSDCNMRWMHIRTDNVEERVDAITLTNFETAAMQAPGLDDSDRTLILHLFRNIRSKSEKTFIHGRYLDPLVTQWHAKYGDDNNKITQRGPKSKSATFFAIPYFSLEKFHSHEAEETSELHPVRSLLQTHYELEPTQSRDRYQILRRLGIVENGIHVPQLWCLLVNKDHIITCAPADISDLFGDIIKTEQLSKMKKNLRGSTVVRFSDPSGQIHFLPCDKCQTWFELLDRIGKQYQPISHLMAGDSHPGWQLLFEDGQLATGDNWAKKLADNDSISMNLELRWQSQDFISQPPGPGVAQAPQSANQNALSPFAISYPGYGTSSYGGAVPPPSPYPLAPSSYTPQPFVLGPYSLPGPHPYLIPSYPAAPPSAISDAPPTKRLTLEIKETELRELVDKMAKLRDELLNGRPSEHLLQQAEKLARLEAELHLQRRADEEKAAIAAHRADMEKEARKREQVAKEAELQHRALKELSPVEFTDCFDRYFKLPYIYCMNWLDIRTLIHDAFKHVHTLADDVSHDRYDLVVDGYIILPSCWPYLVEPGWSVKMSMWPTPAHQRTPIPSQPPEWHSPESISSRLAPSTSSWETGSISGTDDDMEPAMKSNPFSARFRDRRVRSWGSRRTRRYSNNTLGRRVRFRPRRDHSTASGSTSRSNSFQPPFRGQSGEDWDGFETESSGSREGDDASESGYSVEEIPDHLDGGPSTIKRRNFNVEDVTDSSLEIIATRSGTVIPARGSQQRTPVLAPINSVSQGGLERNNSGAAEGRAIEAASEFVYVHDAIVQEYSTWAESQAVEATHVGGNQDVRFGTISSTASIGHWYENLQSVGNISASLELVSTNNFWWERYKSFLDSSAFNTGSQNPGEQQVDFSEVHPTQHSVDNPAFLEGGPVDIPLDAPDTPSNQGTEAHGDLEHSQSPILEVGKKAISDSESSPPILRLRGGGLTEKVLQPKVAYMDDVDEDSGKVIRKSRRSASVKSVKGKSVATQEDLDSPRSNSFTDEEDSQRSTITIDTHPSMSTSSGSDNGDWEGVDSDHSLAPSDSVSIMAKDRSSVRDTEDLYEAGPSKTAPSSFQHVRPVKSALSSSTRKEKRNNGMRAHFEGDSPGTRSRIAHGSDSDDTGKKFGARPPTSSRRPARRMPSTDIVDPLEDYPGYGRGARASSRRKSSTYSAEPLDDYPGYRRRMSASQASPFSPAPPSSFYGQTPQPGQPLSYPAPTPFSAPPSSFYGPPHSGPPSQYPSSNVFSPAPSSFYGQTPQSLSVAPSTFAPGYPGYPAPSFFPGEMGYSEDATSDPAKIYYTPSSHKAKGPSQATSLISGKETEVLSSPRNEIEATQSTSVISGKEAEAPPWDTVSPEEIGTASGQEVSRTKRIANSLTLKDNLTEKVERIASGSGSRPPQSPTISQPSPPATPKTKIPEIFRWPVGEDGSLDDEDIPGSPSLKTEGSFHSNTRSSGAKSEMLFTVLKDAHEQLKSYLARFPLDFDVFNNTEKTTQDEVYELMKAVARRSRGAEDKQADWQLLIDTAQQLLQSFTPPTVDEHLVGIFWGSLARILRTAETHPDRDMTPMYSRAQHYLTIIEEILNGVSVSSSQSKPRYRIPDALVPAFEHLVMVFCIFGSNAEFSPRLHEAEMRHHRRCVDLLIKGKNQLILIHAGDLSEANMYRAVDSEGLAALMFKQIVHIASRGEKKPNILVAYQNYMTKLELQVLEAPSVRVFDDIQDLVQELTIIEAILRQQKTVLEGSLALFSTSAKSQDAFSLITLAKALQDIRKQLNNVTELLQMAQNKKTLLSQAISIRKETNSQAILVFTIVTVIFLPLSFITSYLGMNSIDIRNAAFTQLRFWELAIPLTVFVLVAVWALVKFKRRYSRWIRGTVKYSFRRCFR